MKLYLRGIALAAALLCALSVMPLAVFAEPDTAQVATAPAPDSPDPVSATPTIAATEEATPYYAYRAASKLSPAKANGDQPLAVASATTVTEEKKITRRDDATFGTVFYVDNGSEISFKMTVPADATYTVGVVFDNVNETAEQYPIGLKIDGKLPFAESDKLVLDAIWEDDGGVRELSNGDQVAPAQKHKAGFVDQLLYDESGVAIYPLEYQLTAGEHIFTVTGQGKAFLLAALRLYAPEVIRDYADVSAGYGSAAKYDGDQIVIEAEDSLYRNSYSLSAKSDNGSAGISPASANQSLINYIGSTTWLSPGQEISWQIDVPQDGLYKLGFAFKQITITDGVVYRWLKIDGKTPFAEATEISFDYGIGWQFDTFGKKDEKGKVDPYLFYLTKGPHTLSLAVTLSDIAQVFHRLEEIVNSIGDLYLDMVMITSDSPDPNRDYMLHKQIPDFEKTLKDNIALLDGLSAEIGVELRVNGELDGAIKNMSRILDEMANNLYDSHLYISTYYSAYQTLAAWLYDIKNMSLSLDQIVLAAPDKEFKTPKAGFFQSMLFNIQRFIHSFSATSTVVSGSGKDQPTIKIWVGWGRDQVKILNTLIQDSFTSQKGINVKVEQVNASLVQGVISHNSPDLYLHMARTEPVNLAMRGVLYNLKNFSDYEEVLKRFEKGAETPYLYRDGCYALPDTQSFYVMFYRKDILKELGIEVPKTWDEFLAATGILQRNNMNTYLPYTKIGAATTVNTGAGGLTIFPTMLMQNGGQVYNKELSATALNSVESIRSFTFWTDFYTKYSLEQDANFFNKFRVGVMPLGIAGYTQYLTFRVAAPEIEGKWGMAELPGVMQEDGTINNVCSGSGTGAIIMKSSKNKDAAWEFIKWWTSAETQYRYSAECEAVLGESGRTSTANIEGLQRLSWDSEALDVIMKQWEKVEEIAEVPGSYFVSRSIDQAFWAVKNGTSSPKEAIIDWSEICDKEVARKIAEYADKDPDGE